VSAGLDGAAARGVAQRDVTPRNFGRGPDGRGVLYDLSAGKVRHIVTSRDVASMSSSCSFEQQVDA